MAASPTAGNATAAQPGAVRTKRMRASRRTCTAQQACKRGAVSAERSRGEPGVARNAAERGHVRAERGHGLAVAKVARDHVPNRLDTGRALLLRDRPPGGDSLRATRPLPLACEPPTAPATAGATTLD